MTPESQHPVIVEEADCVRGRDLERAAGCRRPERRRERHDEVPPERARVSVVREVLGVYERQDSSLSRDQTTAWASSLPFFRRLSRQYPEFADEWSPRIEEYERALARVYLDRARDTTTSVGARLRAVPLLLGVHPPPVYAAKVVRSFLPRRGPAANGDVR